MPSQYVPIALMAKTPKELSRKILIFQAKQGGKCSIAAMYWDGKNHVCWIYPLRSLGAAL